MAEHVIWWLTQPEYELTFAMGARDMEEWPSYILDELESRAGRAGRGRLWVSLELAFDDLEMDNSEAATMLKKDSGGIVIRKTDMRHVLSWPGAVTDLKLRPIVLTDIRY